MTFLGYTKIAIHQCRTPVYCTRCRLSHSTIPSLAQTNAKLRTEISLLQWCQQNGFLLVTLPEDDYFPLLQISFTWSVLTASSTLVTQGIFTPHLFSKHLLPYWIHAAHQHDKPRNSSAIADINYILSKYQVNQHNLSILTTKSKVAQQWLVDTFRTALQHRFGFSLIIVEDITTLDLVKSTQEHAIVFTSNGTNFDLILPLHLHKNGKIATPKVR